MEMEGFEALLRASPVRKKDLNVNMSLSYSWNDNIVREMGDPVFDNYGLVTIREGYPKYSLWGQNVVGAVIDTFDLALLGMQGSVPFFDPVNGYQLEEEGFLEEYFHTEKDPIKVEIIRVLKE